MAIHKQSAQSKALESAVCRLHGISDEEHNNKVMDLDALEKIAIAAGGEVWTSNGTGTIYRCASSPVSGPVERGMEVAEVYLATDGKDEAWQAFIAAANPSVILHLVRRLRSSKKQKKKAINAENRIADIHHARSK